MTGDSRSEAGRGPDRGPDRGRAVAPRDDAADVWRRVPTSELADQVLPRWFVLLGLVTLVIAAVAVALALVAYRTEPVPVAERRPPPDATFTTAPGDVAVGGSAPVVALTGCAPARGIRVAGTQADRAVMTDALDALCAAELSDALRGEVGRLARAGTVLRFAQLQDTGIDSTARLDGSSILVNARFAITEPDWIAPLVVHEAVTLAGDPASAATALRARQAEARACTALFTERRASRACDDAEAVLALDDPVGALLAAGFR